MKELEILLILTIIFLTSFIKKPTKYINNILNNVIFKIAIQLLILKTFEHNNYLGIALLFGVMMLYYNSFKYTIKEGFIKGIEAEMISNDSYDSLIKENFAINNITMDNIDSEIESLKQETSGPVLSD